MMSNKHGVMALMILGLNGFNAFGSSGTIARGGLSLANQIWTPSYGTKLGYHIGFNAAVLHEEPINQDMSFLFGGGFESKGCSYSFSNEGVNYSVNETDNYMVFPAMFSFRVASPSPKSGVFISAGLEPSILLSAVADQNTDSSGVSRGASVDVKSAYKSFDLGLRGEVGNEFPLSPGLNGIIGAGISYGLLNVAAQEWSLQKVHAYAIQIYAGLKFK